MTKQEFIDILYKEGVGYGIDAKGIISVDGSYILGSSLAYIHPNHGISCEFATMTTGVDLENLKPEDLKPMIAHYHKFHKYDLLAIVDRIQPFGTDLRYVAANGKTYSIATGMLKTLKHDLKKGIEELQRRY